MVSVKASMGGLMLAMLVILAGSGCRGTYVAVGAGPQPGYYDYTYYPNDEVYFYPPEGVYYWQEGGAWLHGRELPPRFHVDRDHGVSVRLKTAHPYEMHEQVRREHPAVHRADAGERR